MDELLVELFKLDFSSIIIGIFLILSVFIKQVKNTRDFSHEMNWRE